jgi:DNA repair ATPase RecN
MANNEQGISKAMKTKAEKEAEELLSQVEQINGMKYETSRKKKVETLRKELSKVDLICGAITKATGKICTEKPVEGAKRCLRHGGASTGAVTEEGKARSLQNLNPRANFVSGLYGRFVMSAEECTFYETMLNHYIEELDLDPANILLLDRALRNFILNQRKEWAEEGESINGVQFDIDYDMKFMRYMQALGMDRKFNVSKDHKDNANSGGIAMLFMDEE